MRYVFLDAFRGQHVMQLDPQHVGEELEQVLERSGKEALQVDDALKAARSNRSHMHRAVEWNDKKAAKMARRDQMRQVIRALHVEMKGKEGEKHLVQAFTHVTGRGYYPIHQVLKDPILRDELLEKAMREATNFTRKYKVVQELSKVHAEIERTRKRIARNRTA